MRTRFFESSEHKPIVPTNKYLQPLELDLPYTYEICDNYTITKETKEITGILTNLIICGVLGVTISINLYH